MSDHIQTIVIGAGAVGLAIGRELARAGQECLILESTPKIGQGVSSRNSEVIHAGIYYPKGSNKANLCLEGKALLYDFCMQYSVPFKRCGKLIVATNTSELDQLTGIADSAYRNGVTDLIELTQSEVTVLEPNVQALGALLSPSTGILSAQNYMNALLGDFEANGGLLSTQSAVSQI
ncbi:MAG: FAD-dependent oxidoreductase, partial [Gammaproteobacteria bacterium]|nr:FAD-dependent oxidoreductase [Gammaproteobacteria bacterium]